MKRIRSLAWLALATFIATACMPSKQKSFSIYLQARELSTNEMWHAELDRLNLADKPIVSTDDVISYAKATHEIELAAPALERIAELDVPVSGLPFVVCLGRDPVYWGAFWTPVSSLAFGGFVIMQPLGATERALIQIEAGYPPGQASAREQDPRSDAELMRSLDRAGRLK